MDMTIAAKAPDFTTKENGTGYPSAGARIGPAWQKCWDRLRAAPDREYLDGRELANEIAAELEMSPETVVSLLAQAADLNMLQRETRTVAGNRGPRPRRFYRLNRDQPNAGWVTD